MDEHGRASAGLRPVTELFLVGVVSCVAGAVAYVAVLLFWGERHLTDSAGVAVFIGIVWAGLAPLCYIPTIMLATATGLVHPLVRVTYGVLLTPLPLTLWISLLSGRLRTPDWTPETLTFAVYFVVAGAAFCYGSVAVD